LPLCIGSTAKIDPCQIDDFVASPAQDSFEHEQAEAFGLLETDRGRHYPTCIASIRVDRLRFLTAGNFKGDWMNRKNAGIVFALCLLSAGTVGADNDRDRDDDDNVRNCVGERSRDCSEDCKTSRCVAKCEKEAHEKCKVDVIVPQHVFNGAVISTPTNQCSVDEEFQCARGQNNTTAPCSALRGTVANRALWGGSVTVYVICPRVVEGTPTSTSTVIGSTCRSATNGSFTLTAPNACSGQTGCYGLITVAPAGVDNACGVDNPSPATPNGDPGWSTCTSGPCPEL